VIEIFPANRLIRPGFFCASARLFILSGLARDPFAFGCGYSCEQYCSANRMENPTACACSLASEDVFYGMKVYEMWRGFNGLDWLISVGP